MDRGKLIKLIIVLTVIVLLASGFSQLLKRSSMSLTEYEQKYGTAEAEASQSFELLSEASQPQETPSSSPEVDSEPSEEKPSLSEEPSGTTLVGSTLNGTSQLSNRVTGSEGFYYEPISPELRRYMTGVSFPTETDPAPEITFDDLCYMHILHYNFNGEQAEGELVCNRLIAEDLLDIFDQLYANEYQLESVLLIDEFDGDDTASMEANNTSCFNYRPVDGTSRLSKHAYGLALDINPLYNPYVTYNQDGTEKVSPDAAKDYADRSLHFSYKIDEQDLCYRLFTEHGFLWGGNWNNVKDYQHFQKNLP